MDETAVRAARFGTPDASPPARGFALGALSLDIENGMVRGVRLGGVEAIRAIDYPIRDANWGVHSVSNAIETVAETPGGLIYTRRFDVAEGALAGVFTLEADAADGAARLVASLDLAARRPLLTNRAGFILLHPVDGVGGARLTVRRPDGGAVETTFPALIAPAQPAKDIAGLAHVVRGVAVDIAFSGETFEMEDQRNWTDASFKTYCRPLAAPRPFTLAAGETVAQRIEITLAPAAAAPAAPRAATMAALVAPQVSLALEEALAPLGEGAARARALGAQAALVRTRPETAAADLAAAAGLGAPLALEIVAPAGADPSAALGAVAEACRAAGVEPVRVLALPEPYLASFQPEGPWPAGPTPDDLARLARAAFPGAAIGGGMLTNFTELNRRRPHPALVDYVSHETTALVHAADDRSVLETLEALDDVFASARAIAGGKPLHLGLVAIGMRSNPYGAGVAPNPSRGRVPMAMEDPRQDGLFAAAFAVGAAAAAARQGVASFAPAMAAGPLGALGRAGGAVRPLWHAVRALAALAGAAVEVESAPLTLIRAPSRIGLCGVAANLGAAPAPLTLRPGEAARLLDPAAVVAATASPDWSTAPPEGPPPAALAPLDLAFLWRGAAA